MRLASNLDELLRLADFPDWKLWRCRLRLQQPETLSSPPSVGSHRSTRYAAESYSLEILKGWIKHAVRVTCESGSCVDVDMNIVCLPFSHRWRVAADSVHAKGNVCRRGQRAGHWPLNVLQATLCVRPQVRLTLFAKLSAMALFLHPTWHSSWQNFSTVTHVTSTCIQSCWMDANVEINVETTFYLTFIPCRCA